MNECNHCGECCKQPCLLGPGDMARMAAYFNMSVRDFGQQHLRVTLDTDGTLRARPLLGMDGYCHFHIDNRCSIQPVKPAGGRDYECWNPVRTAPGRDKRFFIMRKELPRA